MVILFTKAAWGNKILNFDNYMANVIFLSWAGNYDIQNSNKKTSRKSDMKDIFSCYLQMMLNIGLWKYRIF